MIPRIERTPLGWIAEAGDRQLILPRAPSPAAVAELNRLVSVAASDADGAARVSPDWLALAGHDASGWQHLPAADQMELFRGLMRAWGMRQ